MTAALWIAARRRSSATLPEVVFGEFTARRPRRGLYARAPESIAESGRVDTGSG